MATTLGLVTTLALAAVAGLFTTGDIEMLRWHSTYATVLAGAVLVQLLLSVLMWRVSRGLWRLILVALLVVVMTVVQTAAGDSRTLSVHMPLGMAICAAEALLMYWAYGLRASWRTPAGTTGESGDAPGTGKEEA
ncbi:hypothetical protein ACFT9I_39195 [Streptomyces sp. NPDC057137]|uniref:hypothetical protein n=1 Tax=Streptomyces sp. NPDC057137 TaxID=3346030 RepID=UPI003637E1D8